MKTFFTILFVLLVAIPSFAQEITTSPVAIPSYAQEKVSRIALYSSMAFDLGTTDVALGIGPIIKEFNPVLGQTQNRLQLNLAVIGETLVTDRLTHYIASHGNPKMAAALNFAISGLHIYAGAWNIRQVNKVFSPISSY